MIRVIVSFPNRRQQEVLLAGVPRTGEGIQLRNGPDAATAPLWKVEHVTWVEGEESPPEPSVLVSVRPHDASR